MILNLISVDTVKSHLGITASTYDAALTALIPIVSADIRRVLNNNFDRIIGASFTGGSNQALIAEVLPLGTILDAPYVSPGTYLTAYDALTGYYTLSSAAMSTGAYTHVIVTIGQYPTIAKMIWYKYSKQNTSSAGARGVASESFGPVSVAYSEREINKRYDYPQQLIDDLGIPIARIS